MPPPTKPRKPPLLSITMGVELWRLEDDWNFKEKAWMRMCEALKANRDRQAAERKEATGE